VLLVARSAAALPGDGLPTPLEPAAVVALEDTLRADAAETFAYFTAQGVTIKVISGDNPATVAAVAARAGIPGAASAVDARSLPEDPVLLGEALDAHTVFGRVTPQQKRAMVKALQARGHTVAMTGDGVNDVLALKDADIGVAMGSGSSASRAVAQLVLLDNRFATMPRAVDEGRRVINNLERVANLFLCKTVYAFVIAVFTGVLTLPYPFLPRHITLIGSLTIGVPAFFLALGPNDELAYPGFVRRVLRLSVPAGLAAAVATFGGYALANLLTDLGGDQLRTVAAVCLVTASLVLLAWLARPWQPWKLAVVAAMGGGFALVLVVPPLREFFALELAGGEEAAIVATLMAASGMVMLGTLLAVTRWLPDRRPAITT
jgi:cation-transporting ATPase E